VQNNELELVHRKKQFNTGVQALVFSKDGSTMFSSAGQKEVAVSQLRIGKEDITSVEFGGYSNNEVVRTRDSEHGGDLRIMGMDARSQRMDNVEGYLVSLVFSDSAVKVLSSEIILSLVILV
jgi:hypothetical protein